MTNTSIKSILFDLDGTLLDTAPDFLLTINKLLSNYNRPPLTLREFRPRITLGTEGMLKFAFGINKQHRDYAQLREQFLSIYFDNIAELTRPFPGVIEMLNELKQRDISWGIVTNKYQNLTEQLLTIHQLLPTTACIVCGDTLEKAKPHPEPLWHASQLLNCQPEHCLFVGDSDIDMIAGKRAGMQTLIAKYGYISERDNITAWEADGSINEPAELIPWLSKYI
jgi:N-acetyl-D-muramate 6-phosphate phosphatase